MSLIQNRAFRNSVLRSLVGLYRGLTTPDFVNMCQCLIFLEDPLSVAEILDKLVLSSEDSELMAYQIAFDLYESATQQFLERVLAALRSTAPIPSLLKDKLKKLPEAGVSEVGENSEESTKSDVKEEKSLDSLVSRINSKKYILLTKILLVNLCMNLTVLLKYFIFSSNCNNS